MVVVLHCAYLIVLVPVCYGLFYSFLKMGFFEKVNLLFHFFSFFWGGGGEGTFGKQCIWVYIVPCFVSYKIFEKGKINLGALQG